MSSFSDQFKQQHHYTKILNFQESHPASLIENNYYVLPEKYFAHFQATTRQIYPPSKQDYPKTAVYAYKERTSPLDVAFLNLNHYFTSRFKPKLDMTSLSHKTPLIKPYKPYVPPKVSWSVIKKDLPAVISDFKTLTDKTLSVTSYYSPDDNKQDLLLVCYPGRIDKEDWSSHYDHQNNKTKAQFFAFLWNRKFVTEEQLFQSNAMLGAQAQDILSFKKQLDETGRFNRPLASPTSSRPAAP